MTYDIRLVSMPGGWWAYWAGGRRVARIESHANAPIIYMDPCIYGFYMQGAIESMVEARLAILRQVYLAQVLLDMDKRRWKQ